MKFIELFAGIGGMGHGLMKAGMECVGFVEWDKYAHKAFKLLHDPEERMWARNDITTVSDDDIRLLGEQHRIDLISGGFPCQSFSIAGKRQGFADRTRGTLFFEIIRFAAILKPKHLLLENVKGLLNHDGGRTYATILCALDELGYDCEWQLHNSKNYVPQNRERVFIVGHLRGTSGRKIFPFGRENEQVIDVVGRIESKMHDQNRRVYGVGGVSPTLSTMQGGGQEPKIVVVGSTKPENATRHGQRDLVYDSAGLMGSLSATDYKQPKQVLVNVSHGKLKVRDDDQSTCIDANYAGFPDNHGQRTGVMACLTPERLEKRQNGRRFKEENEEMFTLTAQDKHGVYVPPRIRKLTPLECFRLQSYPDKWHSELKKAGISDSQLYKMAGNGVTSAVAYEIGKRLMEVQR